LIDSAATSSRRKALAPRLLFVPVSGPFGLGEYARSLAIAQAAQHRWPEASIHFILSREAPYAASTPFAVTLLDSSPTFHSAAVIALVENFRPGVVIFDNAGRTAQLRAARRAGARVVYISARSRQRRKAFRLSWMRLIDEHWIAYPQFIAGPLNFLERVKLRVLGRPLIRYLDVILSRSQVPQENSILARLECNAGGYVLVVPGGGTGHPRARDAISTFLAAATALAGSGVATVFVGPTGAADASMPSGAPLRCVASLPQWDLAELMRGARLIVVNGGSTLLQAIACGGACIAIPIARDQGERIRRCVDAQVAIAVTLEAANILHAATGLLQNEPLRAAMAQRAAALNLADGVGVAIDALSRLVESE
jgi:predicted glycosyltransferase